MEHIGCSKVNYQDAEIISDNIYFLRDPLECRQVGITTVHYELDWNGQQRNGQQHGHAADEQEEVSALTNGTATLCADESHLLTKTISDL
ncbi:hypothetical protein SAMN05192552_10356 [Natrinema hispanicum]|uniref:Uncharacterized protein n=1 Tax=Natrinema hispanicum TaxID=392421 RepID=A0A1G6W878_9EURY|nr:hypothetical protein SAMN05192552_10356 [Natrinema hispanicum]SEU09335.1 hypothetical protein SAMN04488694_1427 [Natrinema hispanicum]